MGATWVSLRGETGTVGCSTGPDGRGGIGAADTGPEFRGGMGTAGAGAGGGTVGTPPPAVRPGKDGRAATVGGVGGGTGGAAR
jgi:hypothetical protein